MRNVWLTAKREYIERVRSRAVRISTVLIPLIFGIIFGIGAISGRLASGPKHIVVASNDRLLAESAAAELLAQRDRDGSDSRNRNASGRPRLNVEVKAIQSP